MAPDYCSNIMNSMDFPLSYSLLYFLDIHVGTPYWTEGVPNSDHVAKTDDVVSPVRTEAKGGREWAWWGQR